MFPFRKNNDFSISEQGISEIRTIKIGGIEQSILIQGENPDHPILLFLHGGPSMPVPGVGTRNADYVIATTTKELVKHYVVVFWDQRGTGKSFHKDIPVESLRVEQFVTDAIELVDYLCESFNKEKIYLTAHSWGTVIGLSLVKRIPEKLETYVGISQVVNWSENDKISYKWLLELAKAKGNKKMEKELLQIGEPPYIESFEQWGVLRKWMLKNNSMLNRDDHIKKPSYMDGLKPLLKSRDYRLRDVYNAIIRGFKFSYTDDLIKDFVHVDFVKNASYVDVPVYFLHGAKEKHVYCSLLEGYFEVLEAPKGKKMIMFDKSSHMFHPDDAREIEKFLITLLT